MVRKSELISGIASKTGDSKKATENFLTVFIDTICEKLKNKEEVEVGRLGIFKTKTRKALKGRNPKTGEKIDVPEVEMIEFKAAEEFEKNLNE